MQNSLRVRIAEWLLGQKAGNWQQLFNRGVSETDGNTGALAQPYRFSPWVQRGIKLVSDPIASAELDFTQDGNEIELPVLDDFWQSPVVGIGSFEDFVTAWVGWFKLSEIGRAHV